MNRRSEFLKRSVDIVFSLCLIIIFSPIIALCALLVWATDGGPLFFHQIREGQAGKEFAMWKIRTMRVDAERILPAWLKEHPEREQEWLEFHRLENDPRLIPGVGRLLRRSSLDELPQLWNVLKGDMSLVGPRPLEVPVASQFSPEVLRMRRSMRPGMTGLWQVSARSELGIPAMIELDNQYVQSWSFATDLRLLLRTPAAVTGKSSELRLTPT